MHKSCTAPTVGYALDSEDNTGAEAEEVELIPPETIRRYVAAARQIEPVVPESLVSTIVERYVDMRRADADQAASERDRDVMITARQLLSILRLAQALARLRFNDVVADDDVTEAFRLVECSKSSLLDDGDGNAAEKQDPMSAMWDLCRTMLRKSGGKIKYADLETQRVKNGLTALSIEGFLEVYQDELNLIFADSARTEIILVEDGAEFN